MAQAFLHGNGGSNPLNFKVVGSATEPSNPKENTIWIKTSAKVVSWKLAKQSSIPTFKAVIGRLFLSYSSIDSATTTNANFDALKQSATRTNSIMIGLNAAYLNLDGTSSGWKRMNAYIYKSGGWVQFSSEWNGYYYEEGNEWSTITGGWKAEAKIYGTDGNATITPTLTKSTDHMEFDLVRSDTGGYGATLRTQTAVDLTNVKTLCFDIVGQGSYKQYWLGAIPENGAEFAASIEKGAMSTFTISRSAYKVDVSSLSGKYWIAISIYSASSSTSALNIYNVYGE